MSKALTKQDYLDIANCRGLTWLGDKVVTSRIKTRWRCHCGYEWDARYNDIQQGKGCPRCSGVARLTSNDYRRATELHGLEWIGSLPPNNRTKTTWSCRTGHKWDAPYSSVQRGRGCPFCAGNQIAKVEYDYTLIAFQRGYSWVGDALPKTIKHKTLWQCDQGHVFSMRYNDLQQGRGCPQCGITRRVAKRTFTEKAYNILAARRGFVWLGPKVSSVFEKTRWRCRNGHIWEARHNSIANGSGCPECSHLINGARASKQQLALHEMLGGEINYRVKRYSVDVALNIDGILIAIEYDGWYWHRDRAAEDRKRDKFLLARGWRILHIRSGSSIPERDQLETAINALVQGKLITEIVMEDWKERQDGGD